MALSDNVNYSFRNCDAEKRYSAVVTSAAKIYKGALVVRVLATGKFSPATNDAGASTFAGIATAECDTGDGTVTCEVTTDVEALLTILASTVTIGNTGLTKLYCFDDATVTSEATLGPEIGTMVEWVSSTTGWIGLRQRQLSAST